MISDLRAELLDGPFLLRRRPVPISGDLRIAWGISLIVLILGYSRAMKASLRKLHFLAYAARTKRARHAAMQLFEGQRSTADFHARVEPWVVRAVAFADASGLLAVTGGMVQLSPHGERSFETLSANDELLRDEKMFLARVAKAATEAAIDRALRMEPIG